MIKKILLIFLCFSVFPFSACYDAVEIDDLAYVVAMGIDKGEKKTFRITFQYAVPLNIASGIEGSPGEEAPLTSLTVEADSLHTALNDANGKIAKTSALSHLNLLLLSDSAAMQDLHFLQDELLSLPDLPKTACLALCGGTASDKLAAVSSPLERNPSRYYTDFFQNAVSGYELSRTVSDFLRPDTDTALPYLKSGETFEITGMAILKEHTLYKIYPKQDILLLNLLRGNTKDLKYETANGVYRLDARTKPDISVRPESTPIVSVSLDLTGEPLSGKDFLFRDSKKADADISGSLKADLLQFLYKLTKDDIDLLNLSDRMKKHFLTEKELKAYAPQKKYPASVFSMKIHFRNTKTD